MNIKNKYIYIYIYIIKTNIECNNNTIYKIYDQIINIYK